jgi:hypothetical protein
MIVVVLIGIKVIDTTFFGLKIMKVVAIGLKIPNATITSLFL